MLQQHSLMIAVKALAQKTPRHAHCQDKNGLPSSERSTVICRNPLCARNLQKQLQKKCCQRAVAKPVVRVIVQCKPDFTCVCILQAALHKLLQTMIARHTNTLNTSSGCKHRHVKCPEALMLEYRMGHDSKVRMTRRAKLVKPSISVESKADYQMTAEVAGRSDKDLSEICDSCCGIHGILQTSSCK